MIPKGKTSKSCLQLCCEVFVWKDDFSRSIFIRLNCSCLKALSGAECTVEGRIGIDPFGCLLTTIVVSLLGSEPGSRDELSLATFFF